MPEDTDQLRALENAPWQKRLDFFVDLMREMSSHTDPQKMVQSYGERMGELTARDVLLAVSRRDLHKPQYRITRSSRWTEQLNPWQNRARLPVYDRGVLADFIYEERPRVVNDLEIAPDDPAYEHLSGMRSLMILPQFDRGMALNMVVVGVKRPGGYSEELLPERFWMTNLFGRATHNLVLTDEVKRAYRAVEKELKVVGEIQRSLLPDRIPAIPNLDVAAHYQTAQRAGGDYYDFFPLADGRWGIFIADVSGHGTPAAVLMAVTHSIAHTGQDAPDPPNKLLSYVNRHLATRYTNGTGTFVTAFYGIFDPATRSLVYSCAGHPAPRLKRGCGPGVVRPLEGALGLPLGIDRDELYENATEQLKPDDVLVFYTDGVTESRDSAGGLYGTGRLDDVLGKCQPDSESIIRATLLDVEAFTDSGAPTDDLTLVIAKVL